MMMFCYPVGGGGGCNRVQLHPGFNGILESGTS